MVLVEVARVSDDKEYTVEHLKGLIYRRSEGRATPDDLLEYLESYQRHGNLEENINNMSDGCAPIHIAAQQGMPDIIEILELYDADINIRDHAGNAPLHFAAARDSLTCIEALATRDADILAQNNLNQTPEDVAQRYGQVRAVDKLRSLSQETNVLQSTMVIDINQIMIHVQDYVSRMNLATEKETSPITTGQSETHLPPDHYSGDNKKELLEPRTDAIVREVEKIPSPQYIAKIESSKADQSRLADHVIPLQDFLSQKLREQDLSQLDEIFSDVVAKTQTGLPECIVNTKRGNNTKKIYITYRNDRHMAEAFIQETFPQYWEDDLFVFQIECTTPTLAGEVVVFYCNDHCQKTLGTESCVAIDKKSGTFVLSVKHTLDKSTGKLFDVSATCLEMANNYSQKAIDYVCGYYGGLNIDNRNQVIDVSLIKLSLSSQTMFHPINIQPIDERHVQVVKSGAKTHRTTGVIINPYISENIDGMNCGGIFVVAAYDNNRKAIVSSQKFADEGDSGALVKVLVDNQEISIGIVYKVAQEYKHEGCIFQHVTWCISLNAQVKAIEQLWIRKVQLYERECNAMVLARKRERKNTV